VRRELAAMVTGLETRYDVGDPETMARQPWLGRLAPNAPVLVDGSATSIAACMHGGRALLVRRRSLGATSRSDDLGDRVASAWLPRETDTTGWLADVEAALIRPDGHVAWLATGPEDGHRLSAAVGRWLGARSGRAQVERRNHAPGGSVRDHTHHLTEPQ
jgi:bifunctional hydroxylase/dehydrase